MKSLHPELTSETQTEPSPVVAPRLWPAIGILLVQAVTLVLTVTPSINNALRFGFMILGPGVCVLLFVAWLMLASRLRWRDRFVILLGTVMTGVLAGQLIHSTMGVTMWIYGAPLAMVLTICMLWLGRRWTPSRRTLWVITSVACGWGVFLVARLDGFDGSYWPEFQWRWSKSSEQRLVSTATNESPRVSVVGDKLEVSDHDWPGFRGAARNGRVQGTKIATDWAATPPRELWRIPVGPAWSSFAHVGSRLFGQEQRGESEFVVCYDADTGTEVWRHADAARFSDVVSGAGPRATPTFADGRLYTLGARAQLNCLDAVSGELLWQHDLMTEIDAQLPVWGFAASPIVTDGVVIVYAGGSEDRGLVAYGATSGEAKWHVAGSGMNFSSAQLATLAGRQLVLLASTTSLVAVDPASGRVAWDYTHEGRSGMAIVQPQQIDATSIIVPFGDGGGLARIEVELVADDWRVKERWVSQDLKPSFNDFVYYKGDLYGFDQNIFACIDADSGQRRWKRGRYGFGQVLLFEEQGLLLVTTEAGELVLSEANPARHTELARIEALTGKTWNHPIVAGKRLFVRNGEEAVGYELAAFVESSE